jgi:phospholipase C
MKPLVLSFLLPLTAGLLSATAQQAPVKNVFVIMLENKGFTATFGTGSAAPYLAKTLPAQGELLTEYYGIGHNSNGNYVAMISGQAPNPQNQADCQIYDDFASTGATAPYDQLAGEGCVFPSSVQTVADQLQAAGLTWRGYMEDMPAPCYHPALNTQDQTQTATANDEYATRHNPFVYFHSIVDTSSCAANDVPLTQLQSDLSSAETTPNLVYIVPNLCHDGHDSPCADGEPGGLASVNLWLQNWVPVILNSPAYKKSGMLIITFDEAEYGASSSSDASSCCDEMPGPNSPLPGITGPGGGRVGAVVLSPSVTPGTQNSNPYNHYALLKTVETLFGLPYLGYAQPTGLAPFGPDVFNNRRPAR